MVQNHQTSFFSKFFFLIVPTGITGSLETFLGRTSRLDKYEVNTLDLVKFKEILSSFGQAKSNLLKVPHKAQALTDTHFWFWFGMIGILYIPGRCKTETHGITPIQRKS